jgi:hypothetical protein
MSQKKSKSLESLIKEIVNIRTLKWNDFQPSLERLAKDIKKKDFERLCLEGSIFQEAFYDNAAGRYQRVDWVATRILEYLLPMYVDVGDKILKKSEIDMVKCIVITNGVYKDISSIDEVAKSGSGDSQVLAANFCSIKALRTLKGHKSSKIRKVYFNRLGPVECLDEMLSDSIADIRYEGIARAPYYYDKLKTLTKEIARAPFSLLINKIPLDYLPMLVANRNVKNSWVSSRFEARISSGR